MREIIVPDSPKEIGFTHESWRPYQKEAIYKILNTDKRFVVLNAPTGVGKSLIAVSCGYLLHGKTYIVCSTKQLQKQYLEDYGVKGKYKTDKIEGIRVVIGRQNFYCLYDSDATVAEGVYCSVGAKCPRKDSCPYYIQRALAMESKISIHNYSYFLRAMNTENSGWSKCQLLVLDECHLADNHLSDYISLKFTKKKLKKLYLRYPSEGEDVFEWIEECKSKIYSILDRYSNINPRALPKKERRRYNMYMDILRKFSFLERYSNVKWHVEWTDDYFEISPLWTKYFSHLYFKHISDYGKVLLMSATADIDFLVATLGIKEEETEYIEIPSLFDPKKRPLYFIPLCNMNYKTQNTTLRRVVAFIDTLIENKYKGKKGLIHTVSSYVAKYIYNNSKYNYMMTIASGDERADRLDDYINGKYDILLSPSFETGLNLPYDLLRWQIIVKIPYPSIEDEKTRKRMMYNRKWYDCVAKNRLIQAYGRGMRAEDDYADTYIIDTRFKQFARRVKFPKWVEEAIVGGIDVWMS